MFGFQRMSDTSATAELNLRDFISPVEVCTQLNEFRGSPCPPYHTPAHA